jgi:DNA repair exonuclease SbcCD ATPase subunit
MASEPINIPIKTTYDSKGADEALKDAGKLEDAEPVVEIAGDASQLESEVDKAEGIAQELQDRSPWIAEFAADTAQMRGELEQAQAKLKETGEKADDAKKHLDKIGDTGGPRLAGNQVSDLTGPLGDASGAASDFGGVFDGLADIGEKVAGSVGLDAAKMASAISGIGFAVAAAAAVWTIFKQKQEEAKKKAAEHLKVQEDLNDALKKGEFDKAAEKWIELYGDIIDKGHKAGLSTDELVDGIANSGNAAKTANSKLEENARQIDEIRDAYNKLHTVTQAQGAVPSAEESQLAAQLKALQDGTQGLIDYRDEYADLTQKQKDAQAIQDAVQGALDNTALSLDGVAKSAKEAKEKNDDLTKALDTMSGMLDIQRAAEDFDTDINQAMANTLMGVGNTREEIRGIEDDVLAAAEFTKQNPVVIAQTLAKVQAGDLQGAKKDVDSWYAQNPVSITAVINQEKLKGQIAAAQGGLQAWIDRLTPSGKSAAGASATQTVNVNLPRGARHGDIARAMGLSTRRNGRRYGNPSGTVQYARR